MSSTDNVAIAADRSRIASGVWDNTVRGRGVACTIEVPCCESSMLVDHSEFSDVNIKIVVNGDVLESVT